jgi:phage shock protein PspC (stress-responsive transcriptional regulator)
MNKVTTINLNGRAYQIEEHGYELLQEYLKQAETKLHDNPDKDELMADFEQAIADKCDARLSPRKDVVTAEEIQEIISAMGPVDASGGNAATSDGAAVMDGGNGSASHGAPTPKRLYRIPQDEWITGVCNGLAAYFAVDVTVVRVLFVLLGVITHGFWILAYVILAVVMPVARTEEEFAAARGTKPFNAHDFMEQAQARAEEFRKEFENRHGAAAAQPETPGADASREDWKKWKQDMKEWKHQWKADMRHERDAWRSSARHGWKNKPWQNQSFQDNPTSAGIMLLRFLIGLIVAVLWIAFIFAIWSFLAHGIVFGYAIGAGHPIWVTLLAMALIFWIILMPFKAMMWSARWRGGGWDRGGWRLGGELWTAASIILLFYILSLFFPQVHGAWEHVITYLQMAR